MIDEQGGDLVRADLPNYPVDKSSNMPVRLLNFEQQDRWVLQTGLRSVAGDNEPNHLAQFSADRNQYSLSEGAEELEVVLDWQDTCKAVEAGVLATIERARREGIDLILEGVHLEPSSRLIRPWIDSGGIALGIVMHVDDEKQHTSFLKQRESHSFRNADRYISALPRIRAIQDGFREKARIANWHTLDPTRVKDSMEKIQHWLDLCWNEWRRNN